MTAEKAERSPARSRAAYDQAASALRDGRVLKRVEGYPRKAVLARRALLFANPYEFDYFFGRSRVTVNRPREIGVRWIQRFGG